MGEPIHRKIPRNKAGRDYVVGDVHGCFDLLTERLAYEGFNRAKDRLFSVGDLIDRGPDSEKCLSLLEKPWFHMVCGNHEEMFIDACRRGGGGSWLTSYGEWANRLSNDELNGWADQLEKLPISMTIEMNGYSAGLCHAEPDGLEWVGTRDNISSNQVMVWGRRVLRGNVRGTVQGVDITIHGHTPVELPTWVDNRYFLDTGAWFSGEMTLRQIDDIYKEYSDRQSLFG